MRKLSFWIKQGFIIFLIIGTTPFDIQMGISETLFPNMAICDNTEGIIQQTFAETIAYQLMETENPFIKPDENKNHFYYYSQLLANPYSHYFFPVSHLVESDAKRYWITALYLALDPEVLQGLSVGFAIIDAEDGKPVYSFWNGPCGLYLQELEKVLGPSSYWSQEYKVLFDQIFIDYYPNTMPAIMPDERHISEKEAIAIAKEYVLTKVGLSTLDDKTWKFGADLLRDYNKTPCMDIWNIMVYYYGDNGPTFMKQIDGGDYAFCIVLDAINGTIINSLDYYFGYEGIHEMEYSQFVTGE